MEKNPQIFTDIIRQCISPHSPNWENAWRNFISRYKMTIYQSVTRRCLDWKVSRLKRQLSDTVNDIVSEVFVILYHSLADYRETQDEKKFLFWLHTICNRAASRYLTQHFIFEMADADWSDMNHEILSIPSDARWELYESIISTLRSRSGPQKRCRERDIHIFQLYVWMDCSTESILQHPCLSDLGHRVVDNVVNRLRDSLRSKKTAVD